MRDISHSAKRSDKREAILDAMLSLIVERGLHAAPMSVLAKNASASPGVIYHYFPSKEELLHAVYRRVKDVKSAVILRGYRPGRPAAESFQTIFLNTYNFHRTHQRESSFLAQYENSPLCNPAEICEDLTPPDESSAQFQQIFHPKRAGGVLKDLPQEVLQEMSYGLALRLAKHPATYKPAVLKRIAQTAWTSVAAD